MAKKNLASTLNRAERLAFLERGLQDVPLRTQAELLTVSRASLYYQPAAPSAEELALKRRIDELFTARPFEMRLDQLPEGEIAITIITYEEQMRG